MTKNAVKNMDQAPAIVNNPYAIASAAAKSEGPGTAIAQQNSQRGMIEVMTAFEVAKRFPRDMIEVSNKILKECERPTLAELAIYSFPKGGQTITGPTIRLLEAIARAHGNIRFGWEVLESTKAKSTIRAFAIDLENNTARDTSFDVRHWRDTKQGGYALTDERDIYELQANMAMRRVRGCLQGLIAGDVIEMALAQCEATTKQNIDTSPDGIKKMLEAFAPLGVNAAMIEAKNGGLKVAALRAPHMVVLKKIYAGIRDGIGKVEDYFDITLADKTKEKKKGSDLKEEVAKKKAEKSEKTNAVKDENSTAPEKTEEKQPIKDKDSPVPMPIETRIKERLAEAKSSSDLYDIWTEEYGEHIAAIKEVDPQGYAELWTAYQNANGRVTE